MIFSQDVKDLLRLFQKHDVAYMLVGGHAVVHYGYIRSTQDVDFLVMPSKVNALRVSSALFEFGFGDAGIAQSLFEKEGTAVHLGVEPNRIDLLTHLKGIPNERLFHNRQKIEVDGQSIYIISASDLIAVKKASQRLRDQGDAEELERIFQSND